MPSSPTLHFAGATLGAACHWGITLVYCIPVYMGDKSGKRGVCGPCFEEAGDQSTRREKYWYGLVVLSVVRSIAVSGSSSSSSSSS